MLVVYPIIYLQGFIHPKGGCLEFLSFMKFLFMVENGEIFY